MKKILVAVDTSAVAPFVLERAVVLAKAFDACVLLVRAVGEVQPRDVHPRAHELYERRRGLRSGADGADDFRPANEHSAGA